MISFFKHSLFLFLNWLKKLGHKIGKVQTTLILALLYYFLIAPIGLVFQLVNLVKKAFSTHQETYWTVRDYEEDLKNTSNQF